MASGFFCVDKPEGLTSHDVVSRMRRILGTRKVGHAGTLDPMATGVLMVGCGTSTRLLDYVQAGIKEYVADIRFGVQTNSGDAYGDTINETDMTSLTKSQVEEAAAKFVGHIKQVPPMVSAIKVGGKKLYEYHREGIEIERPARPVYIESIAVEGFVPSTGAGAYPEATIRVRCGAGTYIRTLAEDIAHELGGFGYLIALRRTSNGTLKDDRAISLEKLNSEEDPFVHMISPVDALEHFPNIDLTQDQCRAVSYGQHFELDASQKQIAGDNDVFVVRGIEPRNLVAIYGYEEEKLRSRCVIFLDEQ